MTALAPQVINRVLTDGDMACVENAIRDTVSSDVGLIAKDCEHVVGAGGKRLRPQLLLLAFKAGGGEGIALAVPMAAATELVHTASLVHDDINDHSDLRRGTASVNALIGNSLALLVGDFFFIKLLGLVAESGPRAIRVLAEACRQIVEGETLQMLNLGNTTMTEDTYLDIVTQKTASLFSASAELGGLIGGGTQAEIDALAEYGLNLGIAFQIRDDTLDLTGDASALGKPVANDLQEGKYGLGVLYGLRTLDGMKEALQQRKVTEIQTLLKRVRAVDYENRCLARYLGCAKSALARLPDSPARTALDDLADTMAYRDR